MRDISFGSLDLPLALPRIGTAVAVNETSKFVKCTSSKGQLHVACRRVWHTSRLVIGIRGTTFCGSCGQSLGIRNNHCVACAKLWVDFAFEGEVVPGSEESEAGNSLRSQSNQ